MRLACPNCDATYEVPDSVIPPEGRDVQCSNCGTSWFFDPNPAPLSPEPDPVETVTAAPEPEPEEALARHQEPSQTDAPEIDADAPASEPPPRRPLEAKVTDVLREEAAYEARVRAEEAGLEYQDDLPLEEPPERIPPEPDPDAIAEATGTSRRALLPDIDEINSTLRATSERAGNAPPREEVAAAVHRRRQGFRAGFGLACLTLALAAALYSYAGPVSDRVPALSAPLERYVAVVNDARIWLDATVADLVQRMAS